MVSIVYKSNILVSKYSTPILNCFGIIMARSFLSNYLGLLSPSKSEDSIESKSPIRALPASWYSSVELYELERRAIFSKKWLLTTHKLRLPESGDWLRYEVANFDFVLCRDRTGSINAFHNVCRHRAFPIVTKEEGHNSVFSCKYHGWSYGMNGKLAKAPGYQDMEDFDMSQNGLLRLHVHVDKNGFIWVNMDGKETPEVAWEDDFDAVDEHPRFEDYNFDEYQFDHSWEMAGECNWKILADNYNECYHCKGAHPDIPTVADLNSYETETKKCVIHHFGNPTPDQIKRGFNVSPTFLFPNASLNVSSVAPCAHHILAMMLIRDWQAAFFLHAEICAQGSHQLRNEIRGVPEQEL